MCMHRKASGDGETTETSDASCCSCCCCSKNNCKSVYDVSGCLGRSGAAAVKSRNERDVRDGHDHHGRRHQCHNKPRTKKKRQQQSVINGPKTLGASSTLQDKNNKEEEGGAKVCWENKKANVLGGDDDDAALFSNLIFLARKLTSIFHPLVIRLFALLAFLMALTSSSKKKKSVRCPRRRRRNNCDSVYAFLLVATCLVTVVSPEITSNSVLPHDQQQAEETTQIEGVLGHRVGLPCNLTSARRDDVVYMVLWFRGSASVPIYSLDARGKPFSMAKWSSTDELFGKRSHFLTSSQIPQLVVDEVRESDHGIYRCRVDYRNSPSRESLVNLSVIVPPSEPQIYDTTGLQHRSEIGPFPEGHHLHLRCVVRGGNPPPGVSWYLNDSPLQSSLVSKLPNEVIHEVKVPSLSRSLHRSLLSCRARNSHLVHPIAKTVVIDLNLRPLVATIQRRHSELSTDTRYEIQCESWGSNPPASITWFLDGVKLNSSVQETKTSNSTLSRLVLTPTPDQDGQRLTCRAVNALLLGTVMEDSWKLKVVYPPKLTLRLGTSLNPHAIKENDDVYFECMIQSNPPYDKLVWFHNGEPLNHRTASGVFLSNQSLVLQKVSRPSAGNYSCRATNSQGTGESNQVRLGIMYAPTCQTELPPTEAVIIAASRTEDVNITCHMDALPDNLKFFWSHTNNVGDSKEIGAEAFASQGSTSVLTYNLRSDEDFGAVFCWAANGIGSAEKPCAYQIVPAETPSPVENCSIINRTSTSVEITCEPGFDGGLPQHFFLEAYQQLTPGSRRGLLYNVSSYTSPSFSLSGLDADGTFQFKIFAVNRKGKSAPMTIDGILLTYPPMQSAKARDLKKTTIAIIIGAVSAVVISAIALIVFVVHRQKHPIVEDPDADKAFVGVTDLRSGGGGGGGGGGGSRRSSAELYRNGKSGKPTNIMEIPFHKTVTEFDEDGDPDLIPNTRNAKPVDGLSPISGMYSNGEINQSGGGGGGGRAAPPRGYNSLEKIPLNPLNGHGDNGTSMYFAASAVGGGMDVSNYGTYNRSSGNAATKVNGFQMKPMVPPRRELQQLATSISSSPSGHGKPSSIVVSIDSRLIGQQLASNQLPESCV